MSIELSVVLAAYNEKNSIEQAVHEIFEHVSQHVRPIEVVVVDDGSVDGTGEMLDWMAAQDDRLRVIHKANVGHGPALIQGLQASRGNNLLLVDADCQVALHDFGEHWQAFRNRDAVLGIRAPRHDGSVRSFVSFAMWLVTYMLFGKAPRDGGVPFKLVRAEIWREAMPIIGSANVIPSVMLAVYLLITGRTVVQKQVTHRPRHGSRSTLNLCRLMTLCFKAVIALFAFRIAVWRLSGTTQSILQDSANESTQASRTRARTR